ncbi:G2/mitotic-specific cyclin-B-like [Arctopsyche grandis]|uniref:G2/mitotic-specific cyclin-B-like n=1 Tax=Arctopsyche grandis TaxID=121162 RepID=UPI00406D6C82
MEAARRPTARALPAMNMQENMFVNKAKSALLAKDTLTNGTTKRAVLGNLNGNIRTQPIAAKGKPVVAAENQNMAVSNLRPVTRNYKNVNAKVDTRLPVKTTNGTTKIYDENNPKLLRREESMSLVANAGALATKLKQAKISNILTKKTSSKENLLPNENEKAKSKSIDSNHALNSKPASKESKVISKKKESYSAELLEGVEDIDSGDGHSPTLMGIYIKDIYNYLMELELMYPIKEQHLKGQAFLTPSMRATLINWLIEVHHQFNLTLETLHLTVAIVDRYFQAVKTIKKTQIQLVGITALFVASKYEEMYVPDVQDFVFITDHTYTKHEIFRCERSILAEIKFSLGRPLPLHFERRFIKAAGAHSRNHCLAKYLIDLCLVEYDMAHYRPSELAAAAVCISVSILPPMNSPEKCWTPTLTYYSGYKFRDIQPIMTKLASIAILAKTNTHMAVVNKYNSSKYGQVPSYPELKGTAIRNIAKDPQDS